MSKLDEILYNEANFYTKRGEEGYKLDGTDYEGHTEAKQAIQSLMLELVNKTGRTWRSPTGKVYVSADELTKSIKAL